MAYKNLIMDEYSDEEGYNNLTLLSASVKDEVICAEFHANTQEEGADIIELAVNIEEIIKMRDVYYNKKVEA